MNIGFNRLMGGRLEGLGGSGWLDEGVDVISRSGRF
jgi:hypothetical protein